ncbi:MAG: hypothetical protein Q8M93_15490 [Polaromonas sp.]|uniref:hypothetical protein n=1 Tax=Polaromonas sp. TaxID=1869339 RepID=UPI0027324970|nr:hypothetical protein [Polaromonas sp.]MDP1954615.1 hypothetical protein [Polaromonas sp.]MDP3248353.1 hypothetical protein [Polaromonas sp.]MDP3752306.1 hypothetical protein [Polaromonas sp.]
MHPTPTANEYAHLMDAAKRRASHLRDQAISDLWWQAGVGTRHALRSTIRLVRSLPRHAKSAQQQGA